MNYYKELLIRCDSYISFDKFGLMFDETFGPIFKDASGSGKKGQHHFEKGGLARHTYEVMHLMLFSDATIGSKVKREHIVIAALFHDIGKIWDYVEFSPSVENLKTIHNRKIHHISRSAIEWSKFAEKIGYKNDPDDDILHAILAHHGSREYGSPVAPYTKLAWLLHLCDCISARMDDCERIDLVSQK